MKSRQMAALSAALLPTLLVGLVLITGCASGGPPKPSPIPVGDYNYVIAYTENAARKTMRRHNLPSLAVALIDGDEVIFQQAYGVSKVFTAFEIMRLIDEGLIDLDEPVKTLETGHMWEALLLPLGMTSSGFHSAQIPPQSDVAMGYEYYRGKYYPYAQYDVAGFPSSNLHSTIEDMTRFVRFIFRGGTTDDPAKTTRLISRKALSSMFEVQPTGPAHSQPMGLGWKLGMLGGMETFAWHDGGPTEGIGSLIALLPDRELGVVLMVETKYGVLTSTARGDGDTSPVGIDPEILMQYEGRYVVFGEVMDVVRGEAGLRASAAGMTMLPAPL